MRVSRSLVAWFLCGLAVLGLICALGALADAATQKRPPTKAGETPVPRDVVVAPVLAGGSPYAESWAVIVGINDYRHPRVPKLRYAVNDAQAVERTLRAQGFRPERILTLTDAQATKGRIEGILGDELRTQVGPNDRVLVFFAGHGKTDRLRSGEEEGYLLPVDGDPGRLFSTAISMTALRQISDRIPAKHILYVVDACYSGYALFNRSISDDLYEEMTKKPAIQILTAGRQEDQAQERGGHGIFTEVLVRGLSGDAFPRQKAWLALEELGLWIKQRVFAESNRKQLPQYGNLSGEGQFVFMLPEGPGAGDQGPVVRPPEAPATPTPPAAPPAPPPVASIPPPGSPLTGDLDLTSDPSGATVKLDGREVGKTPLTLERLPVGEHTLDLDKDGTYAARRQITIAANTLEKLSLKLDRLKGKLTVFSDPREATVALDGKEIGTTPLSLETEAGPHALRLTKEGYKPHEETLTLPANKETRTRIALRSTRGTLEVLSTPPGATVRIDGAPRGQAPTTLTLEEGTYEVQLVLPKHRRETRRVQIASEQTIRLRLDLIEQLLKAGDIERRGKDNAEMVFIPAGTFIMGDTHGDGDSDEKPTHQVTLEAFWLDRAEVTNVQFARFIQASGYSAQVEWQKHASGKDQHPVVEVTWHDALAYCRWADKRLPTEAEWEYAARGTDGRKYPWGNTFESSRGRFSGGTAPVGSYPSGASPFGVLDLAGNVWEWTSTLYKPYPYVATDGREDTNVSERRVHRGGSWGSNPPGNLRSAYRSRDEPTGRYIFLGFRCAQAVD